jgi:hypothetical protein
VTVGAGVDEYVRGQRGLARGDLPDVQVVDFVDLGKGDQSVGEGIGVQPGGGGFEEDPP